MPVVDKKKMLPWAPIQKYFRIAAKEMKSRLVDRENEVDMVMTALLANHHPLLVGEPGTAKSMLLDGFIEWMDIPERHKFNALLTKFTVPEELFGIYDVPKMLKGQYERVGEGMLQDAVLAFMDEIFRGSSAIQNTMLKCLNERKFKCGKTIYDIPLRMCVAAANTWPGNDDNGRELGALFDRFLFRTEVKTVSPSKRSDLFWNRNEPEPFEHNLAVDELDRAQEAVKGFTFTDGAKRTFEKIITDLNDAGIFPGDRRMVQSMRACQAYSFYQGASQVRSEHLEILKHTLWVDPKEQPEKCATIVLQNCNITIFKVNQVLGQLEDIVKKCRPTDAVQKIEPLQKELDDLAQHIKDSGGTNPRLDAARKHVANEMSRQLKLTIGAGDD